VGIDLFILRRANRLWPGSFPGTGESASPIGGHLVLPGPFGVFALFNSVSGEEFLWRGVLPPKMNGVFGK
jgi:membrane protease YdiL (CAAX protease family)